MPYRPLLLMTSAILMIACNPNQHDDAWTARVKEKIIAESDLPTDSAFTSEVADMGFKKIRYYSKRTLTREKWHHANGFQPVEILYSKDGLFQLRRELCENGTVSFEGVFFKDQAYGMSTWWSCDDHSVLEQGIRYKGKQVGFWKTKDDAGKTTKVNFGKYPLIDSLERIHP